MGKADPKKVILTFTVSQWYCMYDAMRKMGDVAHRANMPVNWQLSFETALEEKETLRLWHEQYGDELVLIRGSESMADWKREFPWSKRNVGSKAYRQPDSSAEEDGIEGVWGFCDFQVGNDGITDWGAPWGLFRLSRSVSSIPTGKEGSERIGIPWTIRDIHKTYHMGQAINFGVDPIEFIRSRTLDRGGNITFFADLFDELLKNTVWNERVYCCLHEEADGPFIFPGKSLSNEGATPEDSVAMYEMIGLWLSYAIQRGATVMTLPEAVADYKALTNGGVLESTMLTRDKFHGRIKHYVIPFPGGITFNEMGTAGNYPDSVFHYDRDCMLVFDHPSITPSLVLNYQAQYPTEPGRPYRREEVLPVLLDWQTERRGEERVYRYTLTSWYSMPYGLVEWGDFKGWEVVDSNCLRVKILDDRAMLLRFDLEMGKHNGLEANEAVEKGVIIQVRLRRTLP